MASRQSIRNRKRYAEDPEYRARKRATLRSYWAAHKDELNGRRRARRYGISDDDYDALLARQGGVCAICRRKPDRRLAIDHCHSSKQVRGLLCSKCNTGLGLYDDDTDRMRAAIAYLENSRRATSGDATSMDRRDIDNLSCNKSDAMLETHADKAIWTVKPIEDVERTRVAALLAEGLSIRDIAEETGIPKSTVHRLKKKLERDAETNPAETAQIQLQQ